MSTTKDRALIVAVAAVGSVGVWAVAGAREGLGAVATTAAVALWSARVALAEEPEEGFSLDDCLGVLCVMAVVQIALYWAVGDHAAMEGAMNVSVVVALAMLWPYAGRAWVARRRATRESSSTHDREAADGRRSAP